MTAWLAFALLVQEGPGLEELLRRLDADSIETRTEAADLLLRRGAAVIPALESARGAADGELRERIDVLLARVRDRERLAALLRPPSRLTLELKGIPLKDVVELLRARSRTVVEVAEEVAARPVTASLNDVPFWRALEAIARAAGEVRVEAGDGGARFAAGPSAPAVVFDAFAVRLECLSTTEEAELGTPGRSFRTALRFRSCWEKGTRPTRIRAVLERFEDDAGRNGLLNLPQAPEAVVVQPAGEAGAEWTLSFSGVPSAEAERVSIRVAFEADFALRWSEIQIPAPWAAGQSRENAEFGARLVQVDQRPWQLSLGLQVYPRARPVAAEVGAFASVRDDAGRSTPSAFWNPQRNGAVVNFTATFPVAPGRVLKDLRLSVPVEVHTERFVVDLPELKIR